MGLKKYRKDYSSDSDDSDYSDFDDSDLPSDDDGLIRRKAPRPVWNVTVSNSACPYSQGNGRYRNALWGMGYGGDPAMYAPDRVGDCKRTYLDVERRRVLPCHAPVYSAHYQPGHFCFGTAFLRTGVVADEAAVALGSRKTRKKKKSKTRDYRHFRHRHKDYDDDSESDAAGSEYESDDEERRRRRKKFVYVDSKRFTRHKRPFVVRARECEVDHCDHCDQRWGEDFPRRACDAGQDDYCRSYDECMRSKGY